jgi:prolipoprotein diacylglyceryltransferase
MTPRVNGRVTAPSPLWRIGSASVPAFRAIGVSGFVAGAVAGAALARRDGASPAGVLGLSVLAAAVFVVVALVTKVVLGRETLIYYHHELAIVGVTMGVCLAAGASPLRYGDLTIVGVGCFLAFGRVGCFAAGCCHGRPSRRGVRYGDAHVAEGFPAALAFVPLVPVPLIEAAVAILCTAAAASLCRVGVAAGSALVAYHSVYGAARFVLEDHRGDPARAYWASMSHTQWTALGVLAISAALGEVGALPHPRWPELALAIVAVQFSWSRSRRYRPSAVELSALALELRTPSGRLQSFGRAVVSVHDAGAHADIVVSPGEPSGVRSVLAAATAITGAPGITHTGRTSAVVHVVVERPRPLTRPSGSI